MIDRRAFLALVGLGALASPPAALAQQPGNVRVVGVLNLSIGPRSRIVETIRRGLRELGYVEGRTIALDVRSAGGKSETFPSLAADLVRRKVDVLVAIGPAALRAARDATDMTPIMALDLETDPVASGYPRSLSRPGGNVTGLFLDQPGLTGKWLELIGEAAPRTRRVAVLVDTTTGPWQTAAIKAAAEKLRIELQVLEIRGPGELEHAL